MRGKEHAHRKFHSMKKSIFLLLSSVSLLLADEPKSTDASEWQSLFDGETLTGWTNAKGESIEEGHWSAEDGVLTRLTRGSGHLYSVKQYGDFEFSFEWKISEEGNSGVKYRLAKFDEKWLGLEYQILDDEKHPDGKNGGIRQSAALYDLKPAKDGKKLSPVGEWNQGPIVVKAGVVSYFLNGEEVVRLEIPSEEWEKRFSESKYKKTEGFGVNAKGHLQL